MELRAKSVWSSHPLIAAIMGCEGVAALRVPAAGFGALAQSVLVPHMHSLPPPDRGDHGVDLDRVGRFDALSNSS